MELGLETLTPNMPCSIEAEQAVLGSILIDPACMDKVCGIIRKDDFHLQEHGEIFAAMLRMYRSSRNIDVVLLLDELVLSGTYDEAGGTEYIKLLVEIVPTAAHAVEYAKVVHDKAMVRKIIAVGQAITAACYEGSEGYESLIERAEGLVYGLNETGQKTAFTHVREAIMQVYKRLQDLQSNPGKVLGQKTGFNALDQVLVGMNGGDLILVGARPGMGKTSFAVDIGMDVAKTSSKTVCVFSLEMSAEQLANRLLSGEAQIDSTVMRSGQIKDNVAWENIAMAASKISETELLIDDTPGITVTSMRSKLRRVKNLGMVVVDYLGLMQGENHRDNRVLEIGDISRGLKMLAKEFNVPVICCAQLNRDVEKRANKRPMLSDLRDSGAIEQDADVVMFLYRDDYYNSNSGRSVAEVIVAKNRHGSQGTVKLGWIGQWTKFVNLEGDM